MRDRAFLAIIAACALLATPILAAPRDPPSRGAQPSEPQSEEELTAPNSPPLSTPNSPPSRTRNSPPLSTPNSPLPLPTSIACDGSFARNSDHSKLAKLYGAGNVTLTEVKDVKGQPVKASVLFADDPSRRLEVWWRNEEEQGIGFQIPTFGAAASSGGGIWLIIMNGASTWTAPQGMRLGLPLAAVEKSNRKPFKMKGLDDQGVAASVDWQGGALDQVPGGCKFGVSFRADPNTKPAALKAASGDQERVSTNAALRAVKLTVSEVLIGY